MRLLRIRGFMSESENTFRKEGDIMHSKKTLKKAIAYILAYAGAIWLLMYPYFIYDYLYAITQPQTWLEWIGFATIWILLSAFCLVSIITLFAVILHETIEEEKEKW